MPGREPSADGGKIAKRAEENNAAFRKAGTPGGGGYATARAMALSSRPLTSTCAPCAARPRAISNPRPRALPVTRATRPCSENMFIEAQ